MRFGLFPFCPMELSPHGLTAVLLTTSIRSLIGSAIFRPVRIFQCSTPRGNKRRYAKTYFGENQLLPSSMSLSLRTTCHRRVLHVSSVRSSICFSTNFNLHMASSPGFGSNAYYFVALFTLGFPAAPGFQALSLAACINSLAHSSIGTP